MLLPGMRCHLLSTELQFCYKFICKEIVQLRRMDGTVLTALCLYASAIVLKLCLSVCPSVRLFNHLYVNVYMLCSKTKQTNLLPIFRCCVLRARERKTFICLCQEVHHGLFKNFNQLKMKRVTHSPIRWLKMRFVRFMRIKFNLCEKSQAATFLCVKTFSCKVLGKLVTSLTVNRRWRGT